MPVRRVMMAPLSVTSFVAVFLIAGCSGPSATETASDTGDQSTETVAHEHADDHEHEAAAPLTDGDRQLIAAQKTCPVGDSALGSMGDPVKVMIGERAVFLCCEHCRESLLEDPDKYLAKLDNPADSEGSEESEQPPALPSPTPES